jgi:hydrogenase 3 maturation protease
MYAAGEIEKLHLPDVKVFLAGTVPESITGTLRNYRPDHVIFLDAADMGVPPGSIRVVDPSCTQVNLVSSHVLPLTVVMEFITNDTGSSVTLLGIQPDIAHPDHDLSGTGHELFHRNLSTLVNILRSCQ